MKLMVDDLATPSCQEGESENKVISIYLGIGWHRGAVSGFRIQIIRYGKLLFMQKGREPVKPYHCVWNKIGV